MMATASPMLPREPMFVTIPEYRFYPATTPSIFAPSFMPHFTPFTTATLNNNNTTPAAPSSLAKDGDDDQVCAMLLNLKNTFLKREFIPAPIATLPRSISPVLSGDFSSDASSDRKRYRSGESDHEDIEFLPESKSSRLHLAQISNNSSMMMSNGANASQEKPKLRRKRNPSNTSTANKDKQGAEIAHSHQARWMERFNELKTYREKYGNCNVTFAKEHETYKTLAYWVSNQRISYRKRNMPLDRIQMLRDIGFDFNQCGRDTATGAVSPTSFMSFSDSHSSESGSEGEAGMMNPYSPSMKSSKKDAPFATIVNQQQPNNKMMMDVVVVGDDADKQQNCRRKLFEQVSQQQQL